MSHTIRAATNRDLPAIHAVVFSVLAEFGLQPDPDGVDADLDDVEKNYIQRGGVFEVVEDDSGEIVGTVGLYPLDARRVELRKMYMKASARGQGLGKRLMERMVATAHTLGYEEIRLESKSTLCDAIQPYEEFGFTLVEAEHESRYQQVYALKLPAEKPRTSTTRLPVGVPRRFGIGTLLVVTLAYALLFSVLRALKVPGREFAVVVGYITLIGLGQAVLFRGKEPRLASYLVGATVSFVWSLVTYDWVRIVLGIGNIFQELLPILVKAMTLGGLFGYVTGCLIAGVFLVVDRWRGGGRARAA